MKKKIAGESGDKVKVCLEELDDNSQHCQTKKLPENEDDMVKFK